MFIPVRSNEPKRKVCANCKNSYFDGDRYCRFCGAPMGTPVLINETFACIYGPPPKRRIHTCAKCGYSWETELMLDKQCYCPKCGGNAPGESSDQ